MTDPRTPADPADSPTPADPADSSPAGSPGTSPGRAPAVAERRLAIPDHLSPFQVLGENDQALAALEDVVPDTDVHVRGHQVTLRGTEDALRRSEHIMRSLIELAATG